MADKVRNQRVLDENRSRRLQAVKRLEQLIQYAQNPEFAGNVTVEISAKDGALGLVKVTVVEIDDNR